MGAEYPQLYLRYGIWCDVKTVPGWSAVNISSLANDALGEHRRHDTEGMVLEIDAPGCRSSVRRSTTPTCWHAGQENESHGTPAANRGADSRVEPEFPPAGLPGIPDAADLLRLGNRLALGLGALCPFGSLLPPRALAPVLGGSGPMARGYLDGRSGHHRRIGGAYVCGGGYG